MFHRGVLWSVGAAVLWGIEPVLVDEAMDEFTSVSINAWRNLGALMFCLPAALLLVPSFHLELAPLAMIAASGVLSQGLGMYFYSEAIHRAGPGKAIPIVQTFIFWAQLLGFFLFGEVLTLATLAGVFLTILGVWLVTCGGGRDDPLGVAAALLTSVLWAGGDALTRAALFDVSPIETSAWRSLMMFAMFYVLATKTSGLRASRRCTWLALVSGVLGLGLALFMYFLAMSRVGLSLAALPISLSPIISQLTSWKAGREKLGPKMLLGGSLVATGIALASL